MGEMDERYKELKKSFPPESYGEDNSRGFPLTTISAYAVINRLNEVFGLCGEGWWLTDIIWKTIEGEKNLVICCATFCYIKAGITQFQSFPCVGGHQVVKDRWDDAYKSAMTNCICKGASFLGVGLDVYKGEFNGKVKKEIKEEVEEETKQPTKTSGKGISPKQKEKLEQIRKSHLINEDEKIEIQKIIGRGDGIKASEKIKEWWGEDWRGGERQRREYIDEYIKAKTIDMGEPQEELVNKFRKEAIMNMEGLEPSKIAILIKELKNEQD